MHTYHQSLAANLSSIGFPVLPFGDALVECDLTNLRCHRRYYRPEQNPRVYRALALTLALTLAR